MSFLDSVLSSIQTGQPSQLPVSRPPAPPVTSTATKKTDVRKPAPAPRVPSPNGTANEGRKRKAENQLARQWKPEPKPASKPAASSSVASSRSAKAAPKSAAPKSAAPSSAKPASSKPVSKNGTPATNKAGPKVAASAPTPDPAKPPPKGSYAALMLQAKALQEKMPQDMGSFRNQAFKKEKISWVEHKRRLKDIKAQVRAQRSGKPYAPTPRPPPRRLSQSPPAPSYTGTAKPAQAPEKPVYRGTAGLPSKRNSNERSHTKRRANEYLGTDEEDEGDYDGYDDHPSDASSDMEAGFGDVDHEEGAALKSAQKEDEKELRMEMAAKKEKLERQRKLAALVSRKR